MGKGRNRSRRKRQAVRRDHPRRSAATVAATARDSVADGVADPATIVANAAATVAATARDGVATPSTSPFALSRQSSPTIRDDDRDGRLVATGDCVATTDWFSATPAAATTLTGRRRDDGCEGDAVEGFGGAAATPPQGVAATVVATRDGRDDGGATDRIDPSECPVGDPGAADANRTGDLGDATGDAEAEPAFTVMADAGMVPLTAAGEPVGATAGTVAGAVTEPPAADPTDHAPAPKLAGETGDTINTEDRLVDVNTPSSAPDITSEPTPAQAEATSPGSLPMPAPAAEAAPSGDSVTGPGTSQTSDLSRSPLAGLSMSEFRSRAARRRAENAVALNLDTDARQRQHELDKTIADDTTARAAEKRAAGRGSRTEAEPVELTGPMRVLIGFVASVVLIVVAVMGVVIIGTQIAYYQSAMKVPDVYFTGLGIDQPLDLPTFTPIATESVVWACTLMTVVLVLLNRTAGLWTRAMWLFACIEAFVNTYHAIADDGDFVGGVVKGGLSIAAPIVVHLFVLWVKHLRSGKTMGQARIDTGLRWATLGRALLAVLGTVANHLTHPKTAFMAFFIWRGDGGVTITSYKMAWYIAAKPWREKIRRRTGFDLDDPASLGLVFAAPAAQQFAAQQAEAAKPAKVSRKQRREAAKADERAADQISANSATTQPMVSTQTQEPESERPTGRHAAQEQPQATVVDDSLGAGQVVDHSREPVNAQVGGERRAVPPESDAERTQPQFRIAGSDSPSKAEVLRFIHSEIGAGTTPSRTRIIDVTGVKPASLSSYLSDWNKRGKLTAEQVEQIRAA